jgi:hypothetical protein
MRWHVSFSVSKTVAIRFSRCHRLPAPSALRLGQSLLTWVTLARYLGLLFNPKLTWAPQCNQIISSTYNMAYKLSRIITSTGPPPKIIRQLTRVLVESKMTYAWPLWQPPSAHHWRKLEAAICLPLRCAVGLPASTHVLSVFVEFAIARPQYLFDAVALAFAYRVAVKLSSSNTPHPSHLLFKRQQRTVGFTKTNMPFAKCIKKIELDWESAICRDFDHTHADCKSVAAFYPRAVARNFSDLRKPSRHSESDEPVRFARFANHGEPPMYLLSEPRPTAVLRARLRLNRHHFNELLYRAGQQVQSPFCAVCPSEPESVDHILLECPQFHAARQRLRAELMACDLLLLASLDPLNREQTVAAITGELSLVPLQHRPRVLSATATFLHTINSVRPI